MIVQVNFDSNFSGTGIWQLEPQSSDLHSSQYCSRHYNHCRLMFRLLLAPFTKGNPLHDVQPTKGTWIRQWRLAFKQVHASSTLLEFLREIRTVATKITFRKRQLLPDHYIYVLVNKWRI